MLCMASLVLSGMPSELRSCSFLLGAAGAKARAMRETAVRLFGHWATSCSKVSMRLRLACLHLCCNSFWACLISTTVVRHNLRRTLSP